MPMYDMRKKIWPGSWNYHGNRIQERRVAKDDTGGGRTRMFEKRKLRNKKRNKIARQSRRINRR